MSSTKKNFPVLKGSSVIIILPSSFCHWLSCSSCMWRQTTCSRHQDHESLNPAFVGQLYRASISCFRRSCTQASTPYSRRRGLTWEIGYNMILKKADCKLNDFLIRTLERVVTAYNSETFVPKTHQLPHHRNTRTSHSTNLQSSLHISRKIKIHRLQTNIFFRILPFIHSYLISQVSDHAYTHASHPKAILPSHITAYPPPFMQPQKKKKLSCLSLSQTQAVPPHFTSSLIS
jgi:hypothetical protein